MLDALLQNQGLTTREITIYKVLCDLGEQPASYIAKKVGLNRSSCYQHLDRLLSLGLISRIVKNHITYFSANDLLGVLDNLKTSYSRQLKQIDSLKLTLQFNQQKRLRRDHNSKAHFYSGQQALKQLLRQTLTASSQINRIFLSANTSFNQNWLEIFREQLEALQNGHSLTHLMTVKKNNFQAPEHTKLKTLAAYFDIGIDLIIMTDRVVLLSPQEEFAIQIDSRSVASATVKIFDLFWKMARS